ncbi:ABC transporter permease [Solitalea sp. MAHUQ-68]|uniref:ABC transporter permease n=1 Tax=Solitalea agri TaxID=2953739 RepID=A0A9X2FA93_9SPHI|nr:ABC transporter permease [Solitalea agri]MCO4294798.1 ABC transporter permease [Solitalea agri]
MIYLRLIKESFAFAFEALRTNKLRTFLSLLGITIGILTIISILTAVDALKRNVRASVDKLGSNTLVIEKWPMLFQDDYPWWKFINRKPVDEKDYIALMPRVNTVEAAAFYTVTGGKTIKYKSNTAEGAYMLGVTYDMDKVYTLDIEQGRYFTQNEANSGKALAIIGHGIAEGIFKGEEPIGKTIKIGAMKAQVIGVLKKEGTSILNFTEDDNCVYIPLNFAKSIINPKDERNDPRIMLKGKAGIPNEEVEAELKSLMRSIRRLSPQQEDDFAVNKITVLANQIDGLFAVMNMAGWVIGGFSILVGGFGIANIMFVSVKERTHIIGIQKSLGAKNFFILLQFLVEAIALCLVGGFIGMAFVFLLSIAATSLIGFDFSVNVGNIMVGVGISLVIGTLAGFIPAFTASRLDPVEAIRSK